MSSELPLTIMTLWTLIVIGMAYLVLRRYSEKVIGNLSWIIGLTVCGLTVKFTDKTFMNCGLPFSPQWLELLPLCSGIILGLTAVWLIRRFYAPDFRAERSIDSSGFSV